MPKYKLTSRQIDVAKGILVGKSNQEIADSLGIVRNTTEYHIYNLFLKLKLATYKKECRDLWRFMGLAGVGLRSQGIFNYCLNIGNATYVWQS